MSNIFIGYYTLQVKVFVLLCNSWKKTHLQISRSKELSVVCPKVRAKCGEQKGIGQDCRAHLD